MQLNSGPGADFHDQLKSLFDRWTPLLSNGKKVLIWDYRERLQVTVIYRFVVAKDDQSFTLYVGSGDNLSGDASPTSLAYQYRSGNRKETIRPKIEGEIEKFNKKGYDSWTEIIELRGDLKDRREIVENLAIVKYWIEQVRSANEADIPEFLNEKIERLKDIGSLVKRLGIVG